jgi:hypothetical protein
VKADIDRSQSSISPQVTFAMVAVIALAPSDAMNATTSATSANVGSRRSRMCSSRLDVKVSSVVPAFTACRPNASCTSAASGEPADRKQMTRIPSGLSYATTTR